MVLKRTVERGVLWPFLVAKGIRLDSVCGLVRLKARGMVRQGNTCNLVERGKRAVPGMHAIFEWYADQSVTSGPPCFSVLNEAQNIITVVTKVHDYSWYIVYNPDVHPSILCSKHVWRVIYVKIVNCIRALCLCDRPQTLQRRFFTLRNATRFHSALAKVVFTPARKSRPSPCSCVRHWDAQ